MSDVFFPLYAIYGGTFDPIHYGHLKTVKALSTLVGLKNVSIMPNNIPPHRQPPEASHIHRRAMVELAIKEKPFLKSLISFFVPIRFFW